MPNKQWPKVQYTVTRCGGGQTQNGVSFPGGLDLTTPSLALQPGALRSAQNFECAVSGGYSRIGGYERVDGQTKPSSATFIVVQFAAFLNLPAVGNTFTQATSAATGKVVWVNNGAGDGTFWVGLTQVTGTFDTTHNVSNGSVSIGVPITQTAVISLQIQAQVTAAAADVYRALITAVPGTGPIVDVFSIAFSGTDTVYALRANGGNTALVMHASTGAGWSTLPFYNLVSFTAGTGTANDGDVLTQGGVTATIKRVMQQTGEDLPWTGTAAGQFVVTNPSGGNFSAGAATTSSGATVTLSGVQTPIAPLPGGKGQHDKGNFQGQANTKRVYGCDGVNPPYEFDGDTYAPIQTGLSPNAPTHIGIHKSYLIIGQDSSILGSGLDKPFRWDALAGAWEIATGDTVTAFKTLPGSQTTATLAVYQRGDTSFLYGTDPVTFNYVTFNTGLGALPYSAQNMFDSFVFDDLGVVTLQTTLNWGNFLPAALTRNLYPFVVQERQKLSGSSYHMGKSQYRAFFSDGYGLYVTVVNRQYFGSIPVLFPNPVYSIDEADLTTGGMTTYFGSTNGFVYELDIGTSFDGAAIGAWMTLAWDTVKSPRILKRFRAVSIEMQGLGYAGIQFGYLYAYGNPAVGQPMPINTTSQFFAPPNWDSFIWDNFIWDGQTVAPTDLDLQGTAQSIQSSITSGTNYLQPYTIDSLIYHYTPRRGLRV